MKVLKVSNEQDAAADERRRAPRQRAFLRAKIAYLDGSISFDCSVTQISQSGARIALTKEVNLPERFRVEIPQRRLALNARVVRREKEMAAVAFEADDEPAEASRASLLDRIKALEAENRMLRATCETLSAQLEAGKSYY